MERDDSPGGGSSALGAYHDGLDGMRAVSMTAVLLYHGGLGVQGSFLALSQFFTLSGFLITGMLVRSHDRGGVDLQRFWIRRVRRLVPAAFVAIAAVVLFGATVATKDQLELLPGQVVAALLWFYNWYVLAAGDSYVDLFAEPSPLDHFWSLSLEEQFYLFMSFGFVLLTRFSARSRVLIGTFGAISAVSTVWAVYLYRSGASLDRIYLGTDTRITEILFGSILAVVVVRHLRSPSPRLRRRLAWAGAGAYAVAVTSWFVVPLALGPIWNGGMAVYAGLTVLVILAVLMGEGPLVRLLSVGPLAAYGRLTYGVYLYHWPIFLWLDEERTGLSPVPLFAVRAAVTLAAAVASNRLVERPFIEGRWEGRFRAMPRPARLGLVPAAFAVLVLSAAVVSTRDAPDPTATFRDDGGGAAVPISADDGTLDVLAVTDAVGEPVVAALADLPIEGEDLAVTTVPFACSALVQADTGPVCREWSDDWSGLVDELNPDVVVLFLDSWGGRELARLSGRPADEAAAVAEELLGAGLDILTARGAPVVWARAGRSFAEEVVLAGEPLRQAMAALEQDRDDLRLVVGMPDPTSMSPAEHLAASADALLSDLLLYRRSADDRLPRVLVLGDSMARSLSYGIERWALEEDRATVWNAAVPGCGLAPPPPGSDCDDVLDRLPERLESFRPDVVLVLVTTVWDTTERLLPGGDEPVGLGDEGFEALLAESYADVIEVAGAGGAEVVWLTAPCATSSDVPTAVDGATLDRFNDHVVAPAVDAVPGTGLFDLAERLCPGGEPIEEVDGVGELRSDGLHFSVAGSLWFAETYGAELLAEGGL